MRHKLIYFIAFAFVIGLGGRADGSIFLGSFNNDPSGQDSPIERIEAAILAAEGVVVDLTDILYKNDYANSAPGSGTNISGLFPTAFSLGGNDQSGTLTEVGYTAGYSALYFTVKIDGQNAGFNLYKFDSLSSHSFNNVHYGDGSNGFYYEDDKWATNGATTTFGISHVTVWGSSGVPRSFVPEPGTMIIWSAFAGLGLVAARRRRK